MPPTPNRRLHPASALVESLESRQLLSVATSTTIVSSAKSAELGQALTLVIRVKAAKGKIIPTGNVELLSQGKKTGTVAKLNSKGELSLSFAAANALFISNYSLSARYLGSHRFAASKSKATAFKVTLPVFTTAGKYFFIVQLKSIAP